MKPITGIILLAIQASLFAACSHSPSNTPGGGDSTLVIVQDSLPPPFATPSNANYSKVIGWPAGKTPVVPEGFTIERFAEQLHTPRWIYQAADGNIFVSQAATNDILLFRDDNLDGRPELQKVFLSGLNRPFGMLVYNHFFYVANTDGLWRYPYQDRQTSMPSQGEKILDLPAGGYNNHWTRNVIAHSGKLYVSVGSGSNVGENGMGNEQRRAAILRVNPDGSGEKIFASGLRNPVGMAVAPGTQTLYTVVNERDNLGDDLVPDYLTSVQENGFYGWPYSYFGKHVDPRVNPQRPDLVQQAIVPTLQLGAHTASLGLAFAAGTAFPPAYRNGAFIGQHGSWNRAALAGYRVAFVPFSKGIPADKPRDFVSGFIADAAKAEVYGRPAGLYLLQDGSLLVADDAANIIWRVSARK